MFLCMAIICLLCGAPLWVTAIIGFLTVCEFYGYNLWKQ